MSTKQDRAERLEADRQRRADDRGAAAAESMGLGGLHLRSRPDQLRYLAAKLREGESPLAVAFALDMLAGEAEGSRA
jgi:hypothetical protein